MAYGFDEGKNKVNFADYFTYVIDSQAKFDDWLNGVSGNDYSYVAIIGGKGAGENGAYVQHTTNNLTGKTKGIQGFCGAKIEKKSSQNVYVLSASNNGIVDYIRDIGIICDVGNGVFGCSNLTNCTVISSFADCGFSYCHNLTNCTVELTGKARNSYGFANCSDLLDCTYNLGGEGVLYGFKDCKRLIRCWGTLTAGGYGFIDCKRLSFCTASGTTAKYNNCYVTSTANETYKIPENGSDTPNGGFNV